ncbi:MAG: EAL domain-containing protein [Leptospiraceae bacterium]|nr:EAL domain-containing protein [Leptospiraceae bacterium]
MSAVAHPHIRHLKRPLDWVVLLFLGAICIELNLFAIGYRTDQALYLPAFTGFLFACAFACPIRLLPALGLLHIVRHAILLQQMDFVHPWLTATTFLVVLMVPVTLSARLLRRWKGTMGFKDIQAFLGVIVVFLILHGTMNLPLHRWFAKEAGGMFWLYRGILNSLAHATSILLVGRFFGDFLLRRSLSLNATGRLLYVPLMITILAPGIAWGFLDLKPFFNTLILLICMPALLLLASSSESFWVSLGLIAHGWMVTIMTARGLSPLAGEDQYVSAISAYGYLFFVVLSISSINLLTSRRERSREALTIWKEALTRRVNQRSAALMRELDWRKQAELLIRSLARRDAITEWSNRHGLLESLADQKKDLDFAYLVLVSLENYRAIENAEGYSLSESALRDLCERLEGIVPPGMLHCRWDDTHLAFVHTNNGNASVSELNLATFLVMLMESCDEPIAAGRGSLPLRTCACAAPILRKSEDLDTDLEDAFKVARSRLESLAENESTRWSIVDRSQTNIPSTDFKILRDVRNGLEKKEFVLYYQPVISADGLRLLGCEALVRWQPSEGGFIGPGAFIPTVERDELIVDFGFYCANELARFAAECEAEGYGLEFYSLNVAARQLKLGSFAEQLLKLWTDRGLSSARLKVEVTESAFIGSSDVVIANLEKLSQKNVSVALDDFGTGYSSLSCLDAIPLDTIKVDRAFVQNSAEGGSGMAVLAAIDSIAEQLGLDVIVEGIESEEDLNRVHSVLKVSGWQGYHFARPMPAEEFTRYRKLYQPRNIAQFDI